MPDAKPSAGRQFEALGLEERALPKGRFAMEDGVQSQAGVPHLQEPPPP